MLSFLDLRIWGVGNVILLSQSWMKAQSVSCGQSTSPTRQSCSLTRVVRVDDSEDGLQVGVVPVHGLQDAVLRPLLGKNGTL